MSQIQVSRLKQTPVLDELEALEMDPLIIKCRAIIAHNKRLIAECAGAISATALGKSADALVVTNVVSQ